MYDLQSNCCKLNAVPQLPFFHSFSLCLIKVTAYQVSELYLFLAEFLCVLGLVSKFTTSPLPFRILRNWYIKKQESNDNIHRSSAKISKITQNLKPFIDNAIFTPLTIINGFFIKILVGKTVKIVHVDPQTTEIWSTKLKVTLVSDSVTSRLYDYREAELLIISLNC